VGEGGVRANEDDRTKSLGLFHHSSFSHPKDSHTQTFLHHFFCHSHTSPLQHSSYLCHSHTPQHSSSLCHSLFLTAPPYSFLNFFTHFLICTSSSLILSLGFSCFPIILLFSFSHSHPVFPIIPLHSFSNSLPCFLIIPHSQIFVLFFPSFHFNHSQIFVLVSSFLLSHSLIVFI
jgi:hypothetical protein